MEPSVTIRPLREEDAALLERGFTEAGAHKPASQFESYFREQSVGMREVLVAECDGLPVGYGCLLRLKKYGPFSAAAEKVDLLPVIVDFNVLEKYQRRGIGTRLMDALEESAGKIAPAVYLGVGMHTGYGAAQRLYVLRGYVPEGSGMWHGDFPAEPYAPCQNDDSLCIFLRKQF